MSPSLQGLADRFAAPPPAAPVKPQLPKIAPADAPQLQLSKNELGRLADQIDTDYFAAISDHNVRMERFQRYYKRWRGRVDPPAAGEEHEDNFRVPITQWQLSSKLAKSMASLFGADAEVNAKPIGPDDQRRVMKVSRFMTWRLFNSMKIVSPATTFEFRTILNGRAHAYAPWQRDTYWAPTEDGGEREITCYEGPGFFPLWADDFICPAEDAVTLHDFSWVMRRFRPTPNDLLRGEDAGRYQGIQATWQKICDQAYSRLRRDMRGGDQIKREKDLDEGVNYESGLSTGPSLQVHQWYGKWRQLRGRKDASATNYEGRRRFESELVISYIPELHQIISVQDLAAMYPRSKKRRPFVESSLMKEGSYWGPGFGEVLEDVEAELTVNHALGGKAGALSVGPIIIYSPASGFDPEDFEYKPGMAIASDNPAGVRIVEMKADLSYPIANQQDLISISERLTGITDQNIGRTQSTPNAPRTARQTLALLEEGDVRASLDLSVLREDWGLILEHCWGLEQMYGSERVFFRVTEQDSGGLFDTSRGGAFMGDDDRAENYDFDLKFATNAWSRETNKQNQLSLYQLDLQNPLVVQNPRALWLVLDKIHRAFGDDRFSDSIPEPPDIGLPVKPSEEWTRMLQGETVHVNPMDNDQLHMLDHNKRLAEAQADPNHDPDAYRAMVRHFTEHMQQMRQKQFMQALTQKLVESLGSGQGGLVDGAAPVSLQNLHSTVGQMIGAQEAPPEQGADTQPGGGKPQKTK